LWTNRLRKAIDGLCNIVAYDLEKEPAMNTFLFSAVERADKNKILQWASNGFWLTYKRLEKGPTQVARFEMNIGLFKFHLAAQLYLDGLPLNLKRRLIPHLTYHTWRLGLRWVIIQCMKHWPMIILMMSESLKLFVLEQAIYWITKELRINSHGNPNMQLISLEQWRLGSAKQFGKVAEVRLSRRVVDESQLTHRRPAMDVQPDPQTVSYARTKPKRKSC